MTEDEIREAYVKHKCTCSLCSRMREKLWNESYQAGLRDGQAKLGEAKRVAYMQGYEEGKKDSQRV